MKIWPFGKKKRVKVVESDDKTDFCKKMLKFKDKKYGTKIFSDFTQTYRAFLKEYLKLESELTFEEIEDFLSKKNINKVIKNKILKITSSLNDLEYSSKEITDVEFTQLVQDVSYIVNKA